MNLKRRKLLVEPPGMAAPDIAFILIVFFLVCASVQPDTGRPQDIPRSEEKPEESEQSQNIEVSITEKTVLVNGDLVADEAMKAKIQQLLAGKEAESDRVVLVKTANEATYQRWIDVTSVIEEGGGIITLQLEQEDVRVVD